METATGIEVRWLEQDELQGLESVFRARGWVPLNPAMSRVRAAFDNGRMVAFACFNIIPHVEPVFADIQYRGTGIVESLVKDVVEFLYEVGAPAAYVIADSPASAKLAEAYGMARVESPVYRKVV